MVYIRGGMDKTVEGFYLHISSEYAGYCYLTPYAYPIEGVLNITKTTTLHMVPIPRKYDDFQDNVCGSPELVCDNYCKGTLRLTSTMVACMLQ